MKETAFLQIPLWAFNHICISKIANLSAENTDKAVINVSYKKYITDLNLERKQWHWHI